MEQLINHFHSVLDELRSYDDSSSDQHKLYLESFCDIVKGLKPDNPGGRHLKDIMYKRGLPQVISKNYQKKKSKTFKKISKILLQIWISASDRVPSREHPTR